MNLKRFFLGFCLLLVLILTGCHVRENPQDTVLKGRIGFACKGSLFLVGYADSIDKFLGKKSTMDTATIDENGNYRFVLHPQGPNIYDLKSADSLWLPSIYICPTNKLVINFNEKNKDPRIDTSNLEGMYNDFRVKLTYKFFKENTVNQFYYIGANYITINQFDTFVQGRKKQMIVFFDNYFKGQNISPDFKKYALAEINYQYGIDKMMYVWKHRIKNKDIIPDSAYYRDITNKIYLENPDAMFGPAYYHYLNLYVNNIYGESLVKNASRPEMNQKLFAEPIEKIEIAFYSLGLHYQDIVICNIIAGEMSNTEYQRLKAANSARTYQALLVWFEKKYKYQVTYK